MGKKKTGAILFLSCAQNTLFFALKRDDKTSSHPKKTAKCLAVKFDVRVK